MSGFVADLAELIAWLGHGQVTLVGHSLGGNIALRTAATMPEAVNRLVVIEGLGPAPEKAEREDASPMAARLKEWISQRRRIVARGERRLDNVSEAASLMQRANPRLGADLAHHLAEHGTRRLDDGALTWKFDPLVAALSPEDFSLAHKHALWASLEMPTLLVYGAESWASNPARDGRLAHFNSTALEEIAGAGHWLQHDAPDAFLAALDAFLAPPSRD